MKNIGKGRIAARQGFRFIIIKSCSILGALSVHGALYGID